MTLRIKTEVLHRIKDHGRRTYPYECCGVLLGRENGSGKMVEDALSLANARDDSPRNRFLITADDFRRADEEARRRQLDVLGFYHSHPDHPARPSAYDLEHAWPWYSYLVLSVEQGEPQLATSWVMSEDRREFLPEEIIEENESHKLPGIS